MKTQVNYLLIEIHRRWIEKNEEFIEKTQVFLQEHPEFPNDEQTFLRLLDATWYSYYMSN